MNPSYMHRETLSSRLHIQVRSQKDEASYIQMNKSRIGFKNYCKRSMFMDFIEQGFFPPGYGWRFPLADVWVCLRIGYELVEWAK